MYILVDGTIRAATAGAPFTKCNLEINDEHVNTAENLDIVIPMYNLIEYLDNYQDSSTTLYQYKGDEPPADIANDLAQDNSISLIYKAELLGDPTVVDGIKRLNVKIVVPLKYLSNFFRSLEMPLIICKIKLNLTWKKECVLSTDAAAAANAANNAVSFLYHLLSMIQNYIFQLLLCQKKIIKILLNNKVKVFKNLYIGTNIKQKNKLRTRMLMFLNILI